MSLELWDTTRGNLLGEYASDEAALAAVATMLDARGADFVAALVLAVEYEDGSTEIIQTGPALLRQLTPARRELVSA